MCEELVERSSLLAIPLELRNLIYFEVARIYVLTIIKRGRKILLSDQRINNACCSMHSTKTTSTAISLALVSHQIASEARQIAFHQTRSAISVYFSSVCTLSDFESHSDLYQPAILRDFCLSSAPNIIIKSPSAWLALPFPGECFQAMQCLEVAGIAANAYDLDILRMSLKWDGWKKDDELSDGQKWVFLRFDV